MRISSQITRILLLMLALWATQSKAQAGEAREQIDTEVHILYDNSGPYFEWISGKKIANLIGYPEYVTPPGVINIVGTNINEYSTNRQAEVSYDPQGGSFGQPVWEGFLYGEFLQIQGIQNKKARSRAKRKDIITPLNHHLEALEKSNAKHKILLLVTDLEQCTSEACWSDTELDEIASHLPGEKTDLYNRMITDSYPGIEVVIQLPRTPKSSHREWRLQELWEQALETKGIEVHVVRNL